MLWDGNSVADVMADALPAAPETVRDPIAPVFGAIGARTVWVSERPGDGTRLKLVANSWVATLVAATLIDAVGAQYRKAAAAGHGEADMAAIFHAFRP
jgi:3-hydroxyisobutyrate dehydrogenase-like beta-hydroxyacid dehydrogenase